MIRWLNQEDEVWEGSFESPFFRNDENGPEFCVSVNGPEQAECAEQCVEAFQHLSEAVIEEICEKLMVCAKEAGIVFPVPENRLDVLKVCWFMALYVDMAHKEEEIAYVVEGEGAWGEAIGFVMRGDKVVYVGGEAYFDYMENV